MNTIHLGYDAIRTYQRQLGNFISHSTRVTIYCEGVVVYGREMEVAVYVEGGSGVIRLDLDRLYHYLYYSEYRPEDCRIQLYAGHLCIQGMNKRGQYIELVIA